MKCTHKLLVSFILISFISIASVSRVSACIILPPEKIEYVKVNKWFFSDSKFGIGYRITNMDDYVRIFSIPGTGNRCHPNPSYYIKSSVFYTVILIISLLTLCFALLRVKKYKKVV
jgi:hypothetical protein